MIELTDTTSAEIAAEFVRGLMRAGSPAMGMVMTLIIVVAEEDAETAMSLEDALTLAREDEVVVMGGGQIYAQAMPFATRLLVTEVDLDVVGDATAPPIGPEWVAEPGEWMTSTKEIRFRWIRYARS